mgnify:CR=1 FL=1
MNIVNFIVPGMVIEKAVFVSIRIKIISRSIFLIVIFGLCLVLLVIPGGMIVLFLVNILLVGVPGRKAVPDMILACVICVCLTVVSCCAMCLYSECRESDFEDIRQDLALLQSDHEKLKDHVENLETDFYKYDED